MSESQRHAASSTSRVSVLFFAIIRDWAGQDQREVEVGPNETIGDLWGRLLQDFPAAAGKLNPGFAVNHVYVKAGTVLSDGDEVAFIPPVSGG